jgi:hypothetical protein
MKLTAYLFSLYIAILSCMPCADMENGCIADKSNIHQTEEQHSHFDICSPFCICLCCGNQIAFQSHTVALIPILNLIQKENHVTFYKPQFFSNISGSIWQPPKLSENA